jgi:hypothetical protein
VRERGLRILGGEEVNSSTSKTGPGQRAECAPAQIPIMECGGSAAGGWWLAGTWSPGPTRSSASLPAAAARRSFSLLADLPSPAPPAPRHQPRSTRGPRRRGSREQGFPPKRTSLQSAKMHDNYMPIVPMVTKMGLRLLLQFGIIQQHERFSSRLRSATASLKSGRRVLKERNIRDCTFLTPWSVFPQREGASLKGVGDAKSLLFATKHLAPGDAIIVERACFSHLTGMLWKKCP